MCLESKFLWKPVPELQPQGPHSHILMTGGGGGGPKDFFGSDISAERDFLGSMKDAGIFLGIVFSSAQINNNIRERVQISASGHADADQSGADFFRFRFQSVPILSVPIETESAPFKILHRAN